jgi:hypothetical protein
MISKVICSSHIDAASYNGEQYEDDHQDCHDACLCDDFATGFFGLDGGMKSLHK